MKSIRLPTEFTLRERGSKFYGFLFPCSSIDEFESSLKLYKAKYPDATHHCTAYRVHEELLIEFNNDDGEPSGSAGLPILNALRSADLVNCGVDIVRYYGGTKLGKPGLIEAYGETTKGCIELADISQIQRVLKVRITYQYHQEKEIQPLVRNFQLIEDEAQFFESVTKSYYCQSNNTEQLISSLNKLEYLGIKFERIGYTFVMI